MIVKRVELFEPFSEADLEYLEFLPEELEKIESELYPDLEDISFEDVAEEMEAYFAGGFQEAGLEGIKKTKPKYKPKPKYGGASSIKQISKLKYSAKQGGIKTKPKNPHKYTFIHTHLKRDYYVQQDSNNRVTKMSGTLAYTTTKRKKTLKVPNKRKGDQSGHLFAHSLGGPHDLGQNYVAMKREVNNAGGEWGQMESYIRKRLKRPGAKAYMSIELFYLSSTIKRPNRAEVHVRFNYKPKDMSWNIQLP